MKKSLFSFIVIISFSGNSFAQVQKLQSVEEVHAQAEKAIELIAMSEFTAAFEMLKKYWPQPGYQVDGLKETTAQQIPLLEDTFGSLKGYEFVNSKTLGTFGHVENFVLKYEKNALRIYLIYYNSGNGWAVNSLLWDDRWDYLFDDKAKAK